MGGGNYYTKETIPIAIVTVQGRKLRINMTITTLSTIYFNSSSWLKLVIMSKPRAKFQTNELVLRRPYIQLCYSSTEGYDTVHNKHP